METPAGCAGALLYRAECIYSLFYCQVKFEGEPIFLRTAEGVAILARIFWLARCGN